MEEFAGSLSRLKDGGLLHGRHAIDPSFLVMHRFNLRISLKKTYQITETIIITKTTNIRFIRKNSWIITIINWILNKLKKIF